MMRRPVTGLVYDERMLLHENPWDEVDLLNNKLLSKRNSKEILMCDHLRLVSNVLSAYPLSGLDVKSWD